MNLLEKIRDFIYWELSPKPRITLNYESYSQFLPFIVPPVLIKMSMFTGFDTLKELIDKRDKSKELKFV